jgi:hypothetical protein
MEKFELTQISITNMMFVHIFSPGFSGSKIREPEHCKLHTAIAPSILVSYQRQASRDGLLNGQKRVAISLGGPFLNRVTRVKAYIFN